jgi:hypothetical protein
MDELSERLAYPADQPDLEGRSIRHALMELV